MWQAGVPVEPTFVNTFVGKVITTPPVLDYVTRLAYDGGDPNILNVFGGPLLAFDLPVPF